MDDVILAPGSWTREDGDGNVKKVPNLHCLWLLQESCSDRSGLISSVLRHIDIMKPLTWCIEKNSPSLLWDSWQKTYKWNSSWRNITQIQIKGHLAKQLASSLQKCQGHDTSPGWKTRQLNAMCHSGFDLGTVKGH